MQILLSLTALKTENSDHLNNFFIIYDTEKKDITRLKLNEDLNESLNLYREMDLYYANFT